MTDGELESVNRRLAGHRTDGDDREPRLGTWVAGRLAERHDVKVQLRRSAYGGITALVFVPEHLTMAPPGRPAVPRPGAPAGRDASGGAEGAPAGRDAAGDRERGSARPDAAGGREEGPAGPDAAGGREGGALVELPLRRYVSEAPGRAGQDLPKRAPSNSLAPDLAAGEGGRPAGRSSRTPSRDPEQVRNMLSKYRSGLERGRAAAARDLPDDPDDDPPA